GRRKWPDGSRSAEAEQEVVRAQVLERGEVPARGAGVLVTIERLDGPPQDEVAGGPGLGAAEVACEVPVRTPLAEPTHRDEPPLDLVAGQRGERVEIEVAARDPEHVLRLAPREPERDQLAVVRGCEPVARRERVRVVGALAEALDEPVADRERREE